LVGKFVNRFSMFDVRLYDHTNIEKLKSNIRN
jgi:hypothetical protein